MAIEVFLPLNTLLNPLKACVCWKYLPLGLSTPATRTAVIPVRISTGFRWCPRATETGNSQISFWSCRMFGPNFIQETDLSGNGEAEEAGEEGGCVLGELAVCAPHGCSTAQAISNKKVAWKRWIATRTPGRR